MNLSDDIRIRSQNEKFLRATTSFRTYLSEPGWVFLHFFISDKTSGWFLLLEKVFDRLFGVEVVALLEEVFILTEYPGVVLVVIFLLVVVKGLSRWVHILR